MWSNFRGPKLILALLEDHPSSRVGIMTDRTIESRRKDTYSHLRCRNPVDRYLRGFDYKISQANNLFPNTKYTYRQILRIVKFVSKCAGLEVDRFILRSKAYCYKFMEENFLEFCRYMNLVNEEKLNESINGMNLSHDQRYALAIEMSIFLGRSLPEGADVEPLILSRFLVENGSSVFLAEQAYPQG